VNGGNGSGGGEAAKSEAKSVPASAAFTETPPVRPAKMSGLELGPACEQCGGMMQRTGSCYTCSSCGNNTGCG
jgi:ribonucleoside-diphosphate reductase alpha chain